MFNNKLLLISVIPFTFKFELQEISLLTNNIPVFNEISPCTYKLFNEISVSFVILFCFIISKFIKLLSIIFVLYVKLEELVANQVCWKLT